MRGKARYKNCGADTMTAKCSHYVAEYRIQVIKTAKREGSTGWGCYQYQAHKCGPVVDKSPSGDGSLGHLMVIAYETGKVHRTS